MAGAGEGEPKPPKFSGVEGAAGLTAGADEVTGTAALGVVAAGPGEAGKPKRDGGALCAGAGVGDVDAAGGGGLERTGTGRLLATGAN